MCIEHNTPFVSILLNNAFKFYVDFINKNNRGFNFALFAWVLFFSFDVQLLAYALPSDLYKPELTWGQYFVFGTVFSHFIAKMVKQYTAVIAICHINKINYYDTPHIAEAQLACYLGSSNQVY